MPRGSGRPDLSQRPRREAPGMLTAMAILERELGSIDYARHQLETRRGAGGGRSLDPGDMQWLQELEARRQKALELLDDLHAQQAQRQPDAGRSARARPTRS